MLDDLVNQMRREGVDDSCDQQFTLDLVAQARKMADYQAREPALWLLKGVQAAVAAQAPLVQIKLTRQTLELRFVPPPHVDPPQMEEEGAGWGRHLRLAIVRPSIFAAFATPTTP